MDHLIAPNYRLRSVLVILAAGIVYALVSRLALNAFPFSGDEYSYLLQAEAFARGVFKANAPAYADWVQVDHVVIDQFIRSKYPPGTAALLTLGVLAHVPWLVTPLEGIAALIATWATARVAMDERRAFLTTAFLAATPLFAYEAATFLSHTATVLWLSLAILMVTLWSKGKRAVYLVGFGVCVGFLFLTRPLDAVLAGVSLLAFGDIPAVLLAGASAMPFLFGTLWYNKVQFGSPFVDGYRAYLPEFIAVYGVEGSNLHPMNLVSPQQVWNHFAVFETLFAQWTVPGAALMACLGFVALRRQEKAGDSKAAPLVRFLVMLVLVFGGVFLITLANPDDGPRPRYVSALVLPLAFFAAAGWSTAADFVRAQLGARASWVVGVAVWVAPLFLIGAYLERRVPEVVVRGGLAEEVAKEHLSSGVVIVRAEWPTRYARNGVFFDHPPIFLSVAPDVSVADVAARFPGEPIYEAIEPHGDNPWKHGWKLTKVR